MSVDIVKQLDRAKRYIEKNRLDDAIAAYHSVLEDFPNHLESIQAMGDLYTRQNQQDRAAICYGMLFDKLTPPREEPKALALYTRFLKAHPQPPERIARYALLLRKQKRTDEAIEQFLAAAKAFESTGQGDDALSCLTNVTQLDPDNRERQITMAKLAERLGNAAAAACGYLRAGQLSADNDKALECFVTAHQLAPEDRSVTLFYARALLQKDDAAGAAALLASLAENDTDTPLLETYTDALMRTGKLDDARAALERMTRNGNGSSDRCFALAHEYMRAGHDQAAVDLLDSTKKSMLAARRESEFASAVDTFVETYPKSIRLAEFWCNLYAELNRESKYFDALALLFDLYLANNQPAGACESFEKLVDIDPYDSRNQERMDRLQGRVDAEVLDRLKSRLQGVATHGSQATTQKKSATTSTLSPTLLEDVSQGQSLEDLLVQAEIFVQYSLQSKAVERLQRIVELFPGEKDRNQRLQGLFETAHWWPADNAQQPKQAQPESVIEEPANRTVAYAPETLRDLAKISEINQNVFRQPSPRAMLSAAVNDVGNYLRATKCLATTGPFGQPPQMASEFCASGAEPSPGGQIVQLMAQLEKAAPDALGGLPLDSAAAPVLKEMGLETVLGVQLNDPETLKAGGMLIAGFASPHSWKQNETYFLQAIGEQMLLCLHHTRLRSLVRTLAAADEKTGLLARGAYLDCLLRESHRVRRQGGPLALALLQVDQASDLVHQHGEGQFETYMDQLGRAMQRIVRQSDMAVKYTAWALAFILPDTPLSGARSLAEKLRKAASGLRPPWGEVELTTSAVVTEAIARPDFESEDIVTDLINRAEAGLQETQKRGGNNVISLETVGI